MRKTSMKKIKLSTETVRSLSERDLTRVAGGLEPDTSRSNWTDGWCDLTWSGGMICASFAGHCQTR